MMSFAPRKYRRLGLVAAAAAGALVLIGCTDAGGPGGTAGGAGLPYGSSPEEFAAALEDMEPVTLIYQTGTASEDTSYGGHTA